MKPSPRKRAALFLFLIFMELKIKLFLAIKLFQMTSGYMKKLRKT